MSEKELFKILKKTYKRKRAKIIMQLFSYFKDDMDDFSFENNDTIITPKEDKIIKFATNTKDMPDDYFKYLNEFLKNNPDVIFQIEKQPHLYTKENITIFGNILYDNQKVDWLSELINKNGLNEVQTVFSKLAPENHHRFLSSAIASTFPISLYTTLSDDLLNFIFHNYSQNSWLLFAISVSNTTEKMNAFYAQNKDNPHLPLLLNSFKMMNQTDRLFMLNNYNNTNAAFFYEYAQGKENNKLSNTTIASAIVAANTNFAMFDYSSSDYLKAAQRLSQQTNLQDLTSNYFATQITVIINDSQSIENKIDRLKTAVSLAVFNIEDSFLRNMLEVLKAKNNPNEEELKIINQIEAFINLKSYKEILDYYEKSKTKEKIDISALNLEFLKANQQKIVNNLLDPQNIPGEKSTLNYQGTDIETYTLKGEEFKMCVHSIARTDEFSANHINNKGLTNQLVQNPLDFVNDNLEGNIHISASIISDSHSGIFGVPEVLIGFANLKESEILFTSNGDGATPMHAEELIDPKNYLEIYDVSKFSHQNFYNEIVMPRKVGDAKRKPDYIVYMDNGYYQGSYQTSLAYAKSYNVPLVIIDGKSYAQKANQELETRFSESITDNFSFQNILELIKLTKKKHCYYMPNEARITEDYMKTLNRYFDQVAPNVNNQNQFEISELLKLMNNIGQIRTVLSRIQNLNHNPHDIYLQTLKEYLERKITNEEVLNKVGDKFANQLIEEARFIANYQNLENLYNNYLSNNNSNNHSLVA